MKKFVLLLFCFTVASHVLAQDTDDRAASAFDRGNALVAEKQYENAISPYEMAIDNWKNRIGNTNFNQEAVKKNISIAYANIGVCYNVLNNREKALYYFNQSINYDPNNFNAYFHLGVVYEALKQFNQSEQAYKNVIRLKPDEGIAYANLGIIYKYHKEETDSNYCTALFFYEKANTLKSTFSKSVYDQVTLTVVETELKKLKEQGYSSSRANPSAIAFLTNSQIPQTQAHSPTSTGNTHNDSPVAQINKVWVEHNVTHNSIRGMMFHVDFIVVNMRNKKGDLGFSFEYADGEKLGMGVSSNFTPDYDGKTYTDFQRFVPYNIFSVKRNDMRLIVSVYSPTGDGTSQRIAQSDYVYFQWGR